MGGSPWRRWRRGGEVEERCAERCAFGFVWFGFVVFFLFFLSFFFALGPC